MDNTVKILFVDDEQQMLTALKRVFRGEEFEVATASSGEDALSLMEEQDFDIIVSDMRMPEMDGAEFLSQSYEISPNSRRILLTGYADQESTVRAINEGQVHQYLTKPWDNDQLRQVIEAEWSEKQKLDAQSANFEEHEQLKQQVESVSKELEDATSLVGMAKGELLHHFNTTIKIISNLIELRIPAHCSISEEIVRHCVAIAKLLKLSNNVTQEYRHAARLYQLGKISFPEAILKKPFMELSADELEYYRIHPQIGADLLTPLNSLHYAAKIIRHQNENYDGSGTPDHLEGNQIPLGSRILRLAIDYHQLRHGFLFKEKYSLADAVSYLQANENKKYDPVLLNVYAKFLEKLAESTPQLNDRIRKVSDLIPGNIVSRDLINKEGILLVSKGTVLTPATIAKLIDIDNRHSYELNAFIEAEKTDVSD